MAIVEEVIKMKVIVCIGSSCHLRGSQKIVERLQALIAEHQLQDKVDLAATFCTGHCQEGVCTTVDGALHSLTPEKTDEFFQQEILKRLV